MLRPQLSYRLPIPAGAADRRGKWGDRRQSQCVWDDRVYPLLAYPLLAYPSLAYRFVYPRFAFLGGGLRTSSRAPCPGVDSIASSPASRRTLSRITAGPFPVVSNSASDSLPEKENPFPSSSTVNCKLPARCASRTSTWCAPLCLRTFTRLSCTMRASSPHTFCAKSTRSSCV